MRKLEFEAVRRATPIYMARFRLTDVTPWMASRGVKKGDLYLYHTNGCMMPERAGMDSLSPHVSRFEFVNYARVEFRMGQYVVVGWHP